MASVGAGSVDRIDRSMISSQLDAGR